MSVKLVAGIPVMGVAAYYICITMIGPGVVSQVELERGCSDYVRRALPPILSTWSVKEWRARSSSELIASTNLKKLEEQFKLNKRHFGDYRGMDTPTGYVVVDNRGGVNETIGYYSTTARFKIGSAHVNMRLVNRGGGWKFQKFSMRADFLEPD